MGDIFLVKVESFPSEQGDPSLSGFDAAGEFQPDWGQLGWSLQRTKKRQVARGLGLSEPAYAQHRIYDYGVTVNKMLAKPEVELQAISLRDPVLG